MIVYHTSGEKYTKIFGEEKVDIFLPADIRRLTKEQKYGKINKKRKYFFDLLGVFI